MGTGLYLKRPPLWTPSQVATIGWHDATDAATIIQADAAGRVSQWTDKSSNNNHWLQAVAVNQPTTAADSINGLNVIGFDGIAYYLMMGSNPFGATVDDAAIFCVLNIKTKLNSVLFSLTFDGVRRWQAHCPWSSGYVILDVDGISGDRRIQYDPGWDENKIVLMGFIGSLTSHVQQIWEDGVMKAGNAEGYVGYSVPTSGPPSLGRGTTEYDACSIGEFIVINGTVSEDTRVKIEGYLAWKWGLVDGLHVDHPYKLSPPFV